MSFPVSVTDARNRDVTLSSPPKRIVSLVPSQTELLASLGLEENVVGVTRFCELPEHWRKEKTIVGGTKQVDVDTVRELDPDFVLANYEENTAEDVEALDSLAPVFVTAVKTVTEALDMIRTVGALTGTSDQTSTLVGRIISRFQSLPDFPSLRAVFLIWRDPYMTVGGDTFIHDIMSRAGFENAFGDRTRYPKVSLEEIDAQTPDVVLCATEPFPFHKKDKFTADLRTKLPKTPVEIVDGKVFSWYGSHLLKIPSALKSLRKQLKGLPERPRP